MGIQRNRVRPLFRWNRGSPFQPILIRHVWKNVLLLLAEKRERESEIVSISYIIRMIREIKILSRWEWTTSHRQMEAWPVKVPASHCRAEVQPAGSSAYHCPTDQYSQAEQKPSSSSPQSAFSSSCSSSPTVCILFSSCIFILIFLMARLCWGSFHRRMKLPHPVILWFLNTFKKFQGS